MGRDRFDHRVDHSDITSGAGRRRIEIITGPERRRRWSAAEKQAIVAESFEQGAVVSAVARRHEALQRISTLYAIEDEIRGRPADERHAQRQARTKPLVTSVSVTTMLREEDGPRLSTRIV